MKMNMDRTDIKLEVVIAFLLGFLAFKFNRGVFSAMKNVDIHLVYFYMVVSYIIFAYFAHYISKSVNLSLLIFSLPFVAMISWVGGPGVGLILFIVGVFIIAASQDSLTKREINLEDLALLLVGMYIVFSFPLYTWIYEDILHWGYYKKTGIFSQKWVHRIPLEEGVYRIFKYTASWTIPAVAGFFMSKGISAFFDLIYSTIFETIKKVTLFIHSISIDPIKSYMQKKREEKARAERLKAEVVRELEELIAELERRGERGG